jgi:predicted MPP superfamily phosphohydrolase
MKWIRFVAPGVLVVGLVLGLWAFWLEPASLTTREYRLSIPHWDSRLSGLRIAVLADLHVGSPYNGLPKLARVVEATNASRPDLILITGDLVIQEVAGGKFVAPEASAQVLKGLHAPLGVFVVLGNHDWWLDRQRVSAALEHVGIKDLEDDAARIRRGDAAFWLVGISDLRAGPHNFRAAMSRVSDDAPVVLFTHNPDIFPRITGRFKLDDHGPHARWTGRPSAGRAIGRTVEVRTALRDRPYRREPAPPLREQRDRHEHFSGALSRAARGDPVGVVRGKRSRKQ